MYLVYICAVIIPVIIVGSFLVASTTKSQKMYYSDLLSSYNEGVTQTIYEITNQLYTISDSIVYNDELIDFLNGEYETDLEMRQAAADTTLLDKYVEKYAGVYEIRVYVDRDDMVNYGQFYRVTDEIRQSDWYQKAMNQYVPFWMSYSSTNRMGGTEWTLSLVRKMVLVGGGKEAVIMIRARDSYLSSRTYNSRYTTMLAVNDQPVVFSNAVNMYGKELVDYVPVDYESTDCNFIDIVKYENRKTLACVNTLKLTKTTDRLYLVSFDETAYDSIKKIMTIYFAALAFTIILPFSLLLIFSGRFANQVKVLRNEMGKASHGEYTKMEGELYGSMEIEEAYNDLLVMVENIQRMEAEEYENKIKQQNILNEQQKMEFKVLSSQINPHFLYNTLETIRMKALTSGDKEAANAIKLLGKSMRYVLENTGIQETTFKNEFDHILTYLQIQKLRFADRFEYKINVPEDVNLDEYETLPLLLQPIVENSFVHGFENRESGGVVEISFEFVGEDIAVKISDNGNGMDEERLKEVLKKVDNYTRERHKSSIGLYNINRRIKLNYGEEYGINIKSTPETGTVVSVILPAKKV